MADTLNTFAYSSVVSRDSAKIAFLIAALNDINIMACDIGNAYLNAPCQERIWFVAGAECGENYKGMVCKLVRALYGLKSAGASWRAMILMFITNTMNFTPTRADPDVYLQVAHKPDGTPYYEYLLVYVDDILALSHDLTGIMKDIGKEFQIKDNKYGPPTIYLGAGISKFQLMDSSTCWSMDGKQYVQSVVKTVQTLLEEAGRELKTGKRKNHTGPLPMTTDQN